MCACMCAGDTVCDCICVHACMCGLCVYVYVGMCVNAGVWRPEAKLEFLGYYPLFSFETHWPGAQPLLCQSVSPQ